MTTALETIRVASRDCYAQGNLLARNELLDAAVKVHALIRTAAALSASIGFRIDDPRCVLHDALKEALNQAGAP